jgi:CHAT domain-containing protein
VNRLRAKEGRDARRLSALLVAHPVYEREPVPEGASRGYESLKAEASATAQVRLFGGNLKALPGTRREALAISDVVRRAKGNAKLLLGEDATVRELSRHVDGKRFLHFATHGLMGSAERPYDASLALTRPREPGHEDIGFLRLEDILRSWRRKLEGCDLVVLSACNTERGVRSGESAFALPWGFFYAGARTVVASLWEVDDQATALLMVRFYENLLGVFAEPRRAGEREHAPGEAFGVETALGEAKAWLRNLDAAGARKARARLAELGKTSPPAGETKKAKSRAAGEPAASQPSTTEPAGRPYAHPYFWAAFVCVGKGD